jgi:GTP1/Obg family GTP-binding protein
MSVILKGLLQPQIQSVVSSLAVPGPASPAPDPISAQAILVDRLSTAIAIAVQQYLTTNVTVIPGQVTVGGPSTQVTTTPGLLNAP